MTTEPKSYLVDTLAEMITSCFGLRMDEERIKSLGEAIGYRIDFLGLTSDEYTKQLTDPAVLAHEVETILCRLTRSDTYFFRGERDFEVICEKLVPRIISEQGRKGSLRIWCAGCASGEEAYSVAMSLDAHFPQIASSTVIVATDINLAAMEVAMRGVYEEACLKGMSQSYKGYFTRRGDLYEISPTLRKRVRFFPHNLASDYDEWEKCGLYNFDIILCRDVLSQFDKAILLNTLAKLHRSLRPGGFLIPGQGEGVLCGGVHFEYLTEGEVFYCRKPDEVNIKANPLNHCPPLDGPGKA